MRKDIQFLVETGDIPLSPNKTITTRSFHWTQNPSGMSRYIYGEVTLSEGAYREMIDGGVYVNIDYTPKHNEFYLCFKVVYNDGSSEHVTNPANGSTWFLAKRRLNGALANAFASELLSLSDEVYHISFDGADVKVSGLELDVNVVDVERQNANLLLKCHPGNNYRYPTSGVGLERWINGGTRKSDMADIIKTEFEADGVSVNEAADDPESQSLQLSLNAPK